MTQPAERSPSTGTGETTTPPPQTQTSPPASGQAQPQSGSAEPRQRDPNESVYTREDIMDFANSNGYGGAKPEILMGVLQWREQETGQRVTEFTKSDLEEWLPQFLGREV